MHKGYADGGYVGGSAPSVSGDNAPVINIIDQRSGGEPVQTKERRDPNNQMIIDVVVRDAMHRNVQNGSMDKVFNANYGLNRTGTPR